MAEELRIVVVDGGGGGSGGGGGGGVGPNGVPGGRIVAPSVTRLASAVAIGQLAAGLASRVVGSVTRIPGAAVSTLRSSVADASELSGIVAQASAESEIAQFNNRLSRARQLGPGLASFERSRQGVNDALFNVNTQILTALVSLANALEPQVASIASGIENLTEFAAEDLGHFLQALGEGLPDQLFTFFGDIVSIKEWLVKLGLIMQENARNDEDDAGSMLNAFIREMERPPQFWPRGQARPERGGPLFPPGA